MENKIISIILPIYDRQKYAKEALESLEHQTFDHKNYEIIIVTNIPFQVSDTYSFSLKVVSSMSPFLSDKLREGLAESNGKIITFLEDDDLYYSCRLEKINDLFSQNSGLGYFHNSQLRFHSGTEINLRCSDYSFYGGLLKHKMITPNSERQVIRMISTGADFNLSSIAVSRDVAIQATFFLDRFRVKYIDSLFFYTAVYMKRGIIISKDKLTAIRLHQQNASGLIEAKTTYLNKVRPDEEIHSFFKFLLRIGLSPIIANGIRDVLLFDQALKSGNITRINDLKSLIKMIKLGKGKPIRGDVAVKALAFLISRKFFQKIMAIYHSSYS